MSEERTVTELLKMANADAHAFVIHGSDAIHSLQMANEYFRAEEGRPETEWADVTAGLIRSSVRQAYRLSGEEDK
tara:strand:- start:1024 stop:1248 length:225 start_codon:yes stop_codon:yes gene_type:complete